MRRIEGKVFLFSKQSAHPRNAAAPGNNRRIAAHRLPSVLFAAVCAAMIPGAPAGAHAQQPYGPLSAPTRPGTNGAGNASAPTRPPAAAPTPPDTGKKNTPTAATSPSTARPTQPKGAAQTGPAGRGVRFDGLEYIDLPTYARGLGYSATWRKKPEQLALTKGSRRIDITGDSRDFHVNGMRVFAGAPIRMHKNSLWISRIDAENLLAPITDPSRGRRSIIAPRIIAIDAGHGGIDKGMINTRLKIYEKDMALDTAQRLKTLLEKQGFKVVMTRTSDKKIELGDRPEIAAKAGADLFVSIHFNSVEASPQSVSGIEVYRFTPRYQPPVTRSEATNEDKLANPADANTFWSTVAAYDIHRSLLNDIKATDRGFKHHKFAVLRLAKCPAVLIEGGFLSNDAEARKIATPAYRQKLAGAIADGIKDYVAAVAAAGK